MAHEPEPPLERPPAAFEELHDRLRSLRTALLLVGLVAGVALGIGIWALLEAQDREAAGAAEVERLEDQVDQLERDVEQRASDQSVEELRAQQEELTGQLERLSEDTAGEELAQTVEELSQDVAELDSRVDELEEEQQQGNGGASP
jgi:outer membrane murein-binding lipoprotein Lpp